MYTRDKAPRLVTNYVDKSVEFSLKKSYDFTRARDVSTLIIYGKPKHEDVCNKAVSNLNYRFLKRNIVKYIDFESLVRMYVGTNVLNRF